MNSKTIAIAQALVAELAAQDWPAVFSFLLPLSRKELAELSMAVVPVSDRRKKISRSTNEEEHEVAIVFQKGCNPNDLETVMSLCDQVEQVKCLWSSDENQPSPIGLLRNKALADASFAELTNEPFFRPDLLEHASQFTSVISLIYKLSR